MNSDTKDRYCVTCQHTDEPWERDPCLSCVGLEDKPNWLQEPTADMIKDARINELEHALRDAMRAILALSINSVSDELEELGVSAYDDASDALQGDAT
jgi:hypothetical protein